jgi:hypothetical protein
MPTDDTDTALRASDTLTRGRPAAIVPGDLHADLAAIVGLTITRWVTGSRSADELAECGESKHVGLSCVEGVLIDHSDQRRLQRPPVARPSAVSDGVGAMAASDRSTSAKCHGMSSSAVAAEPPA